jgi:hypothetical protein
LFLIGLDHWEQRFWIGYGLAQQFSQNINGSLIAYTIAIALDVANPYPYVYYAEAMVELEEPDVALEYLALAQQQTGRQPAQFANLHLHIQQMKNKILRESSDGNT